MPRRNMALSKVSFREYSFVQGAISQDFECPVCFQILKDPYLTACCGNHFCEPCIEATKAATNECPFCKMKPINGIVDKKFQRQIYGLEVYCLQKKYGCLWAGTLHELTRHLEAGCQYILVSCSYSCGKQFFRNELDKHNNECPLRPYTCEYCWYSSTFADVEKHFYNCTDRPVSCPNLCGIENLKLSDVNQHLLICPNEVVTCSFNEMGCTEKMKRCLLQEHMEKSIIQHQSMICDAFKEMKKENERLKKDNKELRKAQKTSEYWINGYKLMAEGVMKTHWREYLISLAVVSTNIPEPVCPVILKWPGYGANKQRAKEGKDTFYYMRPFYTFAGGYKMQLRVYPNGKDNGKNTHLSVYCHLVPGRNDDYLNWPFKGTIRLSILNQIEDGEHFDRELWSFHHVVPDKIVKKPFAVRNEDGWGYAQFVQIDEIEKFSATKQYLMSDTLFFRISSS